MAQINDHYRKLAAGYLFPEIGRRVTKFCDEHPDANVIRFIPPLVVTKDDLDHGIDLLEEAVAAYEAQ